MDDNDNDIDIDNDNVCLARCLVSLSGLQIVIMRASLDHQNKNKT